MKCLLKNLVSLLGFVSLFVSPQLFGANVKFSPIATQEEIALQNGLEGNSISYQSAVKMALKNIFSDLDDSESPLTLMLEDSYDESKLNSQKALLKKAKKKLREYMARASTQFYLVPLKFDDSNDLPFSPAEHGETVENNWIFFLTIPDYSDHSFWTIVDRSGQKPTYTYGFN